MDRLRIDLKPAKVGSRMTSAVGFVINGTTLVDLVQPVELPHATAEGNPELAGDYTALIVEDFRDRRGLLGEPAATWFEDGDTVLMGCPCGEWGCWPLTVRIQVETTTVRWHGFRNGHREWDLSGLGPFTFNRSEYESAVDVLG